MRIIAFKYEDKLLDWKLEELSFNRLTLLVGASGVGKTQILKSLHNMLFITNGNSLNGVSWSITVETLDKKLYIWEGAYEIQQYDFENIDYLLPNENKCKLIYEKLYLNDILVIDRNKERILFNGTPTIKLSQEQSVVHLLKEEDIVKPLYWGFKDILSSEFLEIKFKFQFLMVDKPITEYDSLVKIQESQLSTQNKLWLVAQKNKKTFETIKQRMIDIFPQLEDIKIAILESSSEEKKHKSLQNRLVIQIKEKNVHHWISQDKISSGILKTLMYLSELYLCAEGTIFLIDEFENSLGINCINDLTSYMLSTKRQLQFVITSHHPYIIDAIHFENWKLVTRNGGIVKTQNVNHFNIGKSKHSAFMQLVQLEEYQTGIA